MTAAEINALPERVRLYVRDLETRCDPAGDVAALTLTRDQNRLLEASNILLRRKLGAALLCIALLSGCTNCGPWLTHSDEGLTLGVQCEWEF